MSISEAIELIGTLKSQVDYLSVLVICMCLASVLVVVHFNSKLEEIKKLIKKEK